MNHADYTAIDAVNWSTLKHMRDSPKAYRHACDNPRADTAALRFGRAVHCMLLTPESFCNEFVVFDDARRGKKWNKFEAESAGRTILKPEERKAADFVVSAVLDCAAAKQYLIGASCEVPITWTHDETELKCKARPDAVKGSVLVELKTTTSADARRFGNEAARYGYHMQLAHYWMGLDANGVRPEKIVLIAAEKNPPYDVSVFVMDDIALGLARDDVSALLRRVRECTDLGQWPGRYPDEQLLSLPTWTEGALEIDYDA